MVCWDTERSMLHWSSCSHQPESLVVGFLFFSPNKPLIALSEGGVFTPQFSQCCCELASLLDFWIHCWRPFSGRHLSAIIPETERGSILCLSTGRSTLSGGRGWTQFKPSPMVGTQLERTKSPCVGWGRSHQCSPNRVEPVPQNTLHGKCCLLEGFPAWPWPRRVLLGVFEAETQETSQETVVSRSVSQCHFTKIGEIELSSKKPCGIQRLNWYTIRLCLNVVLLSVAYHMNASPCSSASDFPVRGVSYSWCVSEWLCQYCCGIRSSSTCLLGANAPIGAPVAEALQQFVISALLKSTRRESAEIAPVQPVTPQQIYFTSSQASERGLSGLSNTQLQTDVRDWFCLLSSSSKESLTTCPSCIRHSFPCPSA